ncbi:MAG: GHKL domain-containing protein [Spirochaetales bacterium]|nr:GHKL domain-containing protein [Spirochaetales bacterium]
MGKIELYKGIAEDNHRRITSQIEENLYCRIASPALDRILDILFSNAIKHTIPQGNIHISLKSDYKRITLVIRNTGPGISGEQLRYIFKKNKQSSYNEKNIPGTGLPFVKKVINEVSGNITIESNVNKETTVTITLKRQITAEEKRYRFIEQMTSPEPVGEQMIRLKRETYNEEKKTLLVLEKDPVLLAFMQENMEEDFNFYFIRHFSRLKQRLKKIPKPDVVIINMIERDYSLSDSVQEIWSEEDILFVFYTVSATQREILKGLRYGGAVDYIDKPCSIKVLHAKILSILHFRENSIIREFFSVKKRISRALKTDKKDDGIFRHRIYLYNLSACEQEIVHYMIRDMDDKEIAKKMNIEKDSVEKHIKNIQGKCGLVTRFQVIKFFRG